MDVELFAKLPDDCISEIVSFTSPVDASVFSIISKRFKVLCESDIVWTKFLPSDIEDYISRSSSSILVFPTKRELYLSLSDSPILLEGGKLSFSLDKKTGKKCFSIAPRELTFTGLDDPNCFMKVSEEVSRFAEVAILYLLDNLSDICGRISCQMLSKETQYASYLVYLTASTIYEGYIPLVEGVCRFVENESREAAEERASLISFDAPGNGHVIHVPRVRPDGWWEVEIGSFFNVGQDQDDMGEVESIVFAMEELPIDLGITIQGIEFRPKVVV